MVTTSSLHITIVCWTVLLASRCVLAELSRPLCTSMFCMDNKAANAVYEVLKIVNGSLPVLVSQFTYGRLRSFDLQGFYLYFPGISCITIRHFMNNWDLWCLIHFLLLTTTFKCSWMLTFTVCTDGICKVVLNWTLKQTVTLSASVAPSLALAVGCHVWPEPWHLLHRIGWEIYGFTLYLRNPM